MASEITRLQQLRLENNMSQSDLARISGVNFRTLQDFDQGRKSLLNAKGEMLYRLCLALDCSMDDLMSGYDIDIYSGNSSSESEIRDNLRRKRLAAYSEKFTPGNFPMYNDYCMFPVVFKKDPIKMEYIFPTKQRLIAEIHDALTLVDEVVSAVLFGSSITMKCTYESDTDIAIRLTETGNTRETRDYVSELVQEICDWNADILWYDRLTADDRVYHDVLRGVQIV